MNEKQYIQRLSEASKAYHNTEENIISDPEFDILYDNFKRDFPKSDYLKAIGAPTSGRKIKHLNAMISMDKAKVLEDMMKWENKLSAISNHLTYAATFKLDGLSGKAVYKNGVLSSLGTRGDGNIGEDISYLIPYINIPKTLQNIPDYFESDGEIILPKDNGVYTEKLRNKAAGIVNRGSDMSEAHLLHFVAYNTPLSELPKVESIYEELKELGFITTDCFPCNGLNEVNNFFTSYEAFLREELNYETDGIVIWVNNRTLHEEIDSTWIVDHHHHYNMAWKPEAEAAETKITNIEWNMSPQGRLIPKAIFKKVILGEADVERATLNNMEWMRDHNVKIGDRVIIEKANDIIPYFAENLEKDPDVGVTIPEICPHCGAFLSVSGVHIVCTNSDFCPGQQLEKVIKFVTELNPDGLGSGTITNLSKEGVVYTLPELFKLTANKMMGLPGFGDSKISNVLSAVEEMRHSTFVELVNALTIPLVGKKALAKLGISSMEEFMAFDSITAATGRNVIEWKESNLNVTLLKELLELMDITEGLDESSGPVVLTGKAHKGRKELEKELEEMGYTLGKSVTKETIIVVTDDVDGTSSKLVKARKTGTPITTYEEFFNA